MYNLKERKVVPRSASEECRSHFGLRRARNVKSFQALDVFDLGCGTLNFDIRYLSFFCRFPAMSNSCFLPPKSDETFPFRLSPWNFSW